MPKICTSKGIMMIAEITLWHNNNYEEGRVDQKRINRRAFNKEKGQRNIGKTRETIEWEIASTTSQYLRRQVLSFYFLSFFVYTLINETFILFTSNNYILNSITRFKIQHKEYDAV